MRRRDPVQERDGRHKAIGLMVIVGVILFIMARHAEAQEWRVPDVPIKYNEAGSPYSYSEVTDAIKHASWIIKKRTGAVSHYSGRTYATDPQLNTVLITWQDSPTGSSGGEESWTYNDSGEMAQSKIYLTASLIESPEKMAHVIAHELGHAMTMDHVDGIGELMTGSVDMFSHGGLGHASTDSSSYSGGDRCFVELMPSGDIFIPDLDGYSAYLWQVSEYQWSLRHYYQGGDGSCDTVSMDGADIIMTDVQGYPGTAFSLVELESIGNDKWILRWAE